MGNSQSGPTHELVEGLLEGIGDADPDAAKEFFEVTELQEYNETLVEDMNVVPVLLTALSLQPGTPTEDLDSDEEGEIEQVREFAMGSLLNLAHTKENLVYLLSLPQLVDSTLCTLPEGGRMQAMACALLMALARALPNKEPLVARYRIVAPLLNVIERFPSAEAAFDAWGALANLSFESRANQEQIFHEHGKRLVPLTQGILLQEEDRLQLFASSILLNLSLSDSIQRSLVQSYGITITLTQILHRQQDQDKVMENALLTLTFLAQNKINKRTLIPDYHVAPAVLGMLESGKPELVIRTVDLLSVFLEDEMNRIPLLVEFDSIPPLCKALALESSASVRIAEILARFLDSPELPPAQKLIDCGGLKHLLSVIKKNAVEAEVEVSLECVMYLANIPSLRQTLRQGIIVNVVKKFIGRNNLSGIRAALIVADLVGMDETEEGKDPIDRATISRMVSLLHGILDENPEATFEIRWRLELVISPLRELCNSESAVGEVMKQGTIAVLVKVMKAFWNRKANAIHANLAMHGLLDIVLSIEGTTQKRKRELFPESLGMADLLESIKKRHMPKYMRILLGALILMVVGKDMRSEPTPEVVSLEDGIDGMHVVVSAASEDKNVAIDIIAQLQAKRYEVWDPEHGSLFTLPLSGDYEITLAESLERAGVLVLCMSSSAKANPLCRVQYTYAKRCGATVAFVDCGGWSGGWLAKPTGWIARAVRNAEIISGESGDKAGMEIADIIGHRCHTEADTKALKRLTVREVSKLLVALDLDQFMERFQASHVDGEVLAECETEEDCVELGIASKPVARKFLAKLRDVRKAGVSFDYLV